MNEPRVLGKAARVQKEGNGEATTDLARATNVGQRNGLSPARIIGDRHEDDGDRGGAIAKEFLEGTQIHVSLERVQRGDVVPFGYHQISSLGAGEFDVGPRGIEMGVVGNQLARTAHHREENPLGGAALVGGNDVTKRKQLLHGGFETEPRGRTGVTLVTVLNGGPLVPRHRAGP